MVAAVEDERVRLGDGAGSTFVSVAAGITDSGDMAFDGSSGLSPGEVLPAVLRVSHYHLFTTQTHEKTHTQNTRTYPLSVTERESERTRVFDGVQTG